MSSKTTTILLIAVTLGNCVGLQAGAQTLTTLYSFSGQDGSRPSGNLLYKNGVLYGTAQTAQNNLGLIFDLDLTSGAETTLHSFQTYAEGNNPMTGVISVGDDLYGTSNQGGVHGNGNVFRISVSSGDEKVLSSFGKGTDGATPQGLVDANGLLYGTTLSGGTAGQGTLFCVDPKSGIRTTVYNFAGGVDGRYPLGQLIVVKGLIYGTTPTGGTLEGGGGTIFVFDPSTNTKTILTNFPRKSYPEVGVIYHAGYLYGTTAGPERGTGPNPYGTVYRVNAHTGARAVLYSFTSDNPGYGSTSALTYVNGALYGTNVVGGSSYVGTIYEVDLNTKAEKVLYNFTGGDDGANPASGLTYYNGTFYGVANSGGEARDGTVFAFTP